MHIVINGIKLFFDVYGSKLTIQKDEVIEKPTLIVLHGGIGFADHTLYVEFWSQFSSIAQVIFLDQRGAGRSDSGEEKTWNLKHWADDLVEFCKQLDISKPIIAGVSMGGHVMCELVSRFPELSGGLIFCNTEARFVLDDVCEALRKKGGDEVAEIAREQFTNPTPEITGKYIKLSVPYYAKNAYSAEEINRCIKHHEVFNYYCRHQMLVFDYLDVLHKIQCPTLFMVGKESPLHVMARAEEWLNE